MGKKRQNLFLYISIGVYLVSLTQKSYCTPGSCEYFSGLLNLIFGWLGVFMLHFPAFPWLANPILLGSWIYFKKKPRISFALSITALFLMLSFLFVDEIIDNEGGTTGRIIFYGLGYWLWVLSSFIVALSNLYYLKVKQ